MCYSGKNGEVLKAKEYEEHTQGREKSPRHDPTTNTISGAPFGRLGYATFFFHCVPEKRLIVSNVVVNLSVCHERRTIMVNAVTSYVAKPV